MREAATAALLVARAKAGEPQAFDALVQRYRKRIFALALHLSGAESDADDIVQDVFIRAFRALDQFERRSEFFTWAYRLTVNRSLDARCTRARRSESSIEEDEHRARAPGGRLRRPARAAELRQTYARALRALDALPPEMRTTVVLVTLQGLSNAEAAVVQGCARGTIAWRLHEGRRRLLEATAPSKTPLRKKGLSEHLGRLLEDTGVPVLDLDPRFEPTRS